MLTKEVTVLPFALPIKVAPASNNMIRPWNAQICFEANFSLTDIVLPLSDLANPMHEVIK
jgi:hypothetical protein